MSKTGDANKKRVYTVQQTPPLMWPCYLEARGNYHVARMLYPQRGGCTRYINKQRASAWIPRLASRRLDLYVAADPVLQKKEARALRFLGDGCHIYISYRGFARRQGQIFQLSSRRGVEIPEKRHSRGGKVSFSITLYRSGSPSKARHLSSS